ncbi:Atxe2 family lasso peptide isopeptidase [Asticcacaulis sp. SL142]|uniref:Atxe2 family lasso peptide isopeptidase n=1 Tax=Asticcacaulis sp. SL142 TaxID=2995155 RepID=UPI00226D06D0|nr:Atxe2 family lasso peptide isopeptidase [Asticcacaulis sp. SL142]WAC49789.1 Atxe2 family lasso peptide isopeptidase [Asticcacaulis sp. SL142]
MFPRVLMSAVLISCGLMSVMVRAAEPTHRTLIETKDISNLAVSPDGRTVAYRVEQASLARNSYDSIWYIQPVDGSQRPLVVADGGVPIRGVAGLSVTEPPVWSLDGQGIFFRALMDGRISVWWADRGGHQSRRLTPENADVLSFTLSPDGRYLRYQSGPDLALLAGAEAAEAEQGILIDQTTVPGQGLFRSAHVNERPTTQKQSGWAGRQSLLAVSEVRVLDLVTGTTDDPSVVSSVAEPTKRSAGLSVIVSGGGVAEVRRMGADPQLLDPPCQEVVYIRDGHEAAANWREGRTCEDGEIASLLPLRQASQIAFTVTSYREGLSQSLKVWDIKSGQIRTVRKGEGLLAGSRSPNTPCVAGEAALVCVSSAATAPPRLVAIDLTSGRETVLADPNADTRNAYGEAVLLNWSGASGRVYSGWYLKSPSPRSPLMIAYNSCPGFLRGAAGDEWPLAVFAAQGISALCINRPFGYPRDPKVRYGYGLDAVEGAIRHLSKRGDIDPHRVGMGGLSFGSEVVMWTLMKSDLIAAASVSSPMTSPLAYTLRSLQGDDYWRELKASWGLDAPEVSSDAWKVISPALNIDEITEPLLLQMPEQEYWGALEYYIPMRNQRAPTELYAFPFAPHNKVQPRQKLAVYARNLDWFRFWLADYEDPDPHKADQYARWRVLKARRAVPEPAQ